MVDTSPNRGVLEQRLFFHAILTMLSSGRIILWTSHVILSEQLYSTDGTLEASPWARSLYNARVGQHCHLPAMGPHDGLQKVPYFCLEIYQSSYHALAAPPCILHEEEWPYLPTRSQHTFSLFSRHINRTTPTVPSTLISSIRRRDHCLISPLTFIGTTHVGTGAAEKCSH
jgi:hypothetical protein